MNPYFVALVAFLVVMAGMAFLMGLFYALRAAGARIGGAPAEPVSGVNPELLAVVAAAASEALQAPVRLHRVHVHRGPVIERWSRAGRMDIMVSRRVEPKR
ncbi:MAG TPA: hypothetical protein PLN93_14600 [Vicinamibacterales bacterium]|nr:hypothetical protein [Vicinamibacterales bacterium]HOG27679.1 hypothetical protein [Vicinamibacterales bacterium]HOQ61548.1 hypothetical protein [Vicinamibacterales bacterium]HPK73170.1 hypothetical protein [Vicinamibacterales bacterium]HPW20005.1 hypothetical protein [Vicinamibacterales bacterium]